MSENKCPCCGCPMVEKYLGWVCPADNCAFRCPTNSLPRIAAAMKAEARHNALVEAIHKAMGRTADCDKKQTDNQLVADVAYLKRIASDYFKSSADWRCRSFAAEQERNALREAVKWEREFDEVLVWLVQTGRYPRDMAGKYDLANERECARDEVDRLIANESAADCKGEE